MVSLRAASLTRKEHRMTRYEGLFWSAEHGKGEARLVLNTGIRKERLEEICDLLNAEEINLRRHRDAPEVERPVKGEKTVWRVMHR